MSDKRGEECASESGLLASQKKEEGNELFRNQRWVLKPLHSFIFWEGIGQSFCQATILLCEHIVHMYRCMYDTA